MKKIILSLITAAVPAAASVAAALFKNTEITTAGRGQTCDNMEKAENNAPFKMRYSERRCGIPLDKTTASIRRFF